MSKRRNRRDELDFEIHVDPSCHASEQPETVEIMPSDTEEQHRESLGSDFGGEGSLDEPNWVAHDETADGDSVSNEDAEDTVIRRESDISIDSASYRPSPAREASIRAAAREALRKSNGSSGSSRRSSIRSAAPSDISYDAPSSRHSLSTPESRGKKGSSRRTNSDGGGSNSSHQEHEDDVFSDHSPRSSMGSIPEAEQYAKAATAESAGKSRISDIQPYDPDEAFVPTIRGTPRPAFRSPSAFQPNQMHSPPPSVTGSTGRRTPRTSISRLGSPSTQFSPKKTPPRFKRNTPPLVLLHVTLLPLRWPWGQVIENARPSELSKAGQALREAWRQLQDRVGDTVSDRGVLLPHPQNDFEVLEERLLEAVELPLRRRARILECGHYLGPANEMSLVEDMDSEDEDYEGKPAGGSRQKHWCSTCRSDIHFDSLGEGKVFRTKVYASNGLMKAGAWEACWKQMERVDVEIEPIVDQSILDELEQLATVQERVALEEELQESLQGEARYRDELFEEEDTVHMETSPMPDVEYADTPESDHSRHRDEERLREIYGDEPSMPTPQMDSTTAKSEAEEYISKETPPSPTVEAMERRKSRQQAYKSASLPELVMEAAKVFFQDRKNGAIVLLGVLVMMLAVRTGGAPPTSHIANSIATENSQVPSMAETHSRPKGDPVDGGNPCASCELALEAAQISCGAATVTVTETMTVAAAATTEVPTSTAVAEAEAEEDVEESVEERRLPEEAEYEGEEEAVVQEELREATLDEDEVVEQDEL